MLTRTPQTKPVDNRNRLIGFRGIAPWQSPIIKASAVSIHMGPIRFNCQVCMHSVQQWRSRGCGIEWAPRLVQTDISSPDLGSLPGKPPKQSLERQLKKLNPRESPGHWRDWICCFPCPSCGLTHRHQCTSAYPPTTGFGQPP